MSQPLVFVDAQEAFERAIKSGVLSKHETDSNYAGDYMYMHTQGGRDGFKNRDTRRYLWN